jgi:hypothetical protein
VIQILTSNAYSITAMEYGSQTWTDLNSSSPGTFRAFNDSGWKDIYNTDYLPGYGDLFLAIDRFGFEPSQDFEAVSSSEYLPTSILNGSKSNLGNFTRFSLPWIDYKAFVNLTSEPDRARNPNWPEDARIAQTLATVLTRQNRIQLSLDFMAIVIGFNALKLLVMLWVLFTDRSEYLVTIGDAAASFLRNPDHFTAEQCMLDRDIQVYRTGHQGALDPETSSWATMQERLSGVWQPTKLRYSASLPEDRQKFFAGL